jgi:acyl-CoA thioester hydrolase
LAREEERWLEGRHQFPVYYEDTDFSGYVYHANYLKYFERAREELVGLQYVKEMYARGVHYVVYKMDLTFQAPARHGDIITVDTRMRLSESPRGQVEQACKLIDPENPDKEPIVLCHANIKLAAVNSQGEAIRVPKDVVEHFAGLI